MAINQDLNRAQLHPDVLRNVKKYGTIRTMLQALQRLLQGLGGTATEFDTEVSVIDSISELAENGGITPAVLAGGGEWYGVCSTAAATAKKEVTIDGLNALTVGMTVRIKFTKANTAASPKLKSTTLMRSPCTSMARLLSVHLLRRLAGKSEL